MSNWLNGIARDAPPGLRRPNGTDGSEAKIKPIIAFLVAISRLSIEFYFGNGHFPQPSRNRQKSRVNHYNSGCTATRPNGSLSRGISLRPRYQDVSKISMVAVRGTVGECLGL